MNGLNISPSHFYAIFFPSPFFPSFFLPTSMRSSSTAHSCPRSSPPHFYAIFLPISLALPHSIFE
ncbi:hypothetical protein IC582_005671 [Cucumis melo]